ncbi:hypothetical protein D3C87_1903570 [compost metagenome]
MVIALRYIRVTLPLKKTAREFSKMLLAGAALVVAVQIDAILLRQFGDVKFVRFGALAFTILFGAAVYIFASVALRIEVCESLLTHLRTKFRQR